VLLIAVSSGFSTFLRDFPAKKRQENRFPDLLKGKHKHTARHAHKKESCEAGFFACGGSRKRHSSIPLQCDPRGAFLIVWKQSFLYDKEAAT